MFLGIDSGQTALKVVVFDDDGVERYVARRPTVTVTPRAHHVERDAQEVVDQLLDAIAEAVSATEGGGKAIDGIGIVAHGDGIYLVDSEGRATRNGILALDTRAEGILARWNSDGTMERARAVTGQEPFAASLAPLLAWLVEFEPEAIARTRWAFYCKDWLRFSLTGEVATDFVEANSCVGSLDGTSYSREALHAFGLSGLVDRLPLPRLGSDVAGGILPAIAERTGLRSGTPVVVGTHDVVAAALGTGATRVGDYSILAGTYSVNQYISADRVVDTRWQARPWLDGESWILMSASPASATNFEWFMRTLMADTDDPIVVANREVASLEDDANVPLYHPFLYGSPFGAVASASFLGMRAWHGRPHLIRSVWEGVVHNHRTHLDWLSDAAGPRTLIRLAGGASRSDVWAQMFADALDAPIEVSTTAEPGALGAAMLSAIGVGRFADTVQVSEAWAAPEHTYPPRAAAVERWNQRHARYSTALEVVRPLWELLDEGGA